MVWYDTLAAALSAGDHAVFDADGTLWSGDVGEGFAEALVREGRLPPAAIAEYERRLARSYTDAYVFATTCLAGLAEGEVRSRAEAFFARTWRGRIFPEMRALLARLEARGVSCWVASASNRWVVEAGARELGIPPERVMAMTVEVEGGRLTDRIVPPPVTGAGKAEALRIRLPAPPALVAGNSANDLAMLRLATRCALVVNASPGVDPRTGEDLLAEARARGWQVRDLASAEE